MAKNQKCQGVKDWFVGFTTLGGLVQIFASTDRWSKAMWVVLFVSGFIGTLVGLQQTFGNYFEFNVVTSVTIAHSYTLPFPSVTICNANRVHCGQLYKLIRTCQEDNCPREELFCSMYTLTQCKVSIEISEKFAYGGAVSNLSLCDGFNFTAIKDLLATSNSWQTITAMFYDIYLSFNQDEIFAVAHQPEDMIRSCAFINNPGSSACTELLSINATKVLSPRYGVCYVFNYASKDYEGEIGNLQSTSEGPDYGLSLTLDMETSYYMRYGLTPNEGATIILDEKAKFPCVLSRPIQISPNTKTSVEMTLYRVTRQETPYTSNCSNSYPSYLEPNAPADTYYSSITCLNLCLTQYIEIYCGCLDPLLMEARDNFDSTGLTFCSTNVYTTERDCVHTASANYSHQASPCPCMAECAEYTHHVSLAQTVWPSDAAWGLVAEDMNIKYRNQTMSYVESTNVLLSGESTTEYTTVKEHITGNFMQVDVYYGSMNLEEVTMSKEYESLGDLMSTLGGVMSLYLGVTLVSAFEGLELTIRIINATFRDLLSCTN